jgi:protein-disulfide isomerase
MRPQFTVPALVLIALTLLAGRAGAQSKVCDALGGTQREVAQAVLASQHPYDCCDATIAKCLQKKPVCPLAQRLADAVCRLAAAGKTQAEIERELQRRAASTMGTKYTFDLSHSVAAGDPKAKVTIVVYACARCPYCARLMPKLYESVTSGSLKGKAKLYLRPFPIRNHQHSAAAGMAWVAAQRLGHFWEMVQLEYSHFDDFDPNKLPDLASSKGMDREKFRSLLDDPAVRDELTASKKEGVRNKVDVTPSVFIDGRRYMASLDPGAIDDFVEERLQGASAP